MLRNNSENSKAREYRPSEDLQLLRGFPAQGAEQSLRRPRDRPGLLQRHRVLRNGKGISNPPAFAATDLIAEPKASGWKLLGQASQTNHSL